MNGKYSRIGSKTVLDIHFPLWLLDETLIIHNTAAYKVANENCIGISDPRPLWILCVGMQAAKQETKWKERCVKLAKINIFLHCPFNKIRITIKF